MLLLNDERWDRVNSMTGGEASVCFQCGSCSAHCPINAISDSGLNMRKIVRSAQLGLDFNGELWNCATCKLCETTCPREVGIVDVVLGLRSLAFEEKKAPEKIEKVVWDIYENGNPWGGKKGERSLWADGLGIKDARAGVKVLFFVGCESAYSREAHESLRSITEIMSRLGVDFGILGNDERCCGEPVLNAGELGYMEEIASQNIAAFQKTGAEIVVTASPHCSNTFRNYYSKHGLKARVMHYSEFFYDLFRDGKLKLRSDSISETAYHDPCVLSRYDDFVSGPREMLSVVTRSPLIEMEHTGRESLCCGGGGNRMFLDFEGARLADRRMDESAAAGAKNVVTACPYCVMNLRDSSDTRKMGIRVRDLAEVLRGALA